MAAATGAQRESLMEYLSSLRDLRGAPDMRRLKGYDLERSYRTSAPVLSFVDDALAEIGHTGLGLESSDGQHIGSDGPGQGSRFRVRLALAGENKESEHHYRAA